MEHKNNNHQGQGNGFLLGVIVGVILTLLFTTKRGRAIFKDVMEKGTEKFADLEKLMRESETSTIVEEEENDFAPSTPVEVTPEPPKEKKVETAAVPAPKSAKQEEPAKQEEKPIEKSEKTEAFTIEENPKEVEKKEEKKETKPKAVSGKRWFRGLRKKN